MSSLACGCGGKSDHQLPRIFAPGPPANIDARLLDNSDKALVSSFQKITLQPDELPLRPGFGTAGRSIKLRANFFPVRVPKGPLFEYTVSISPATTLRRVKRRIFQLAEGTSDWARSGLKGNVAHDHSQKLVTAKQLPQPLTIRVPFYDEDEDGPQTGGKEYTLTIEFSGNLDMQSLHKCVACVDLFLLLSMCLQLSGRHGTISRLRHPSYRFGVEPYPCCPP